MDYGSIDQSKSAETVLHLPVRRLTEDEARELLAPLLVNMGEAEDALRLFGSGTAASWTVAALTDSKRLRISVERRPP